MNNQAQNEWPKTWPAWVIKIATEFETAEKEPEFLSSDDAPPWVHTLERELLEVIHPALNLTEGKECGARFLGTRSCNPAMKNERIWDYSGRRLILRKALNIMPFPPQADPPSAEITGDDSRGTGRFFDNETRGHGITLQSAS